MLLFNFIIYRVLRIKILCSVLFLMFGRLWDLSMWILILIWDLDCLWINIYMLDDCFFFFEKEELVFN